MKDHHTRILLIDGEEDCSFFREAMTGVSASISVSCLKYVGRLMEAIKSTKPSLVFMEDKLPGKNGVDCVLPYMLAYTFPHQIKYIP